MASLAHIAVGAGAGKLDGRKHAWIAYSVLSMLPDADVIAFVLGIPYEAPFGHRGASHSLFVAIVIGLVLGLLDRRTRTMLLCLLVCCSHALLDTLTDGGLGIALLWPFSNERFFAPFQPIPVAPIGPAFFSTRGLWCLVVEAAITAPIWLWLINSRRTDQRATASSR